MTVQENVQSKLQSAFSAVFLSVENESHRHAVAPGSETHFKVVLVSPSFAGQNLVSRHRAVYDVLRDEMSAGLHALALHTYTPEEWEQRQQGPASPPCLGGSKPDPQ